MTFKRPRWDDERKNHHGGGDDEQPEKHSRCGVDRIRVMMAASAGAQEVKHYRFAYDQPKTTGYGILGDIFCRKLKALSKGTMLIDQYPGAQLGQEPQVLQLVKVGRRRILHFVVGQCRDAVAAGRRDVDALPVPLGSAPHQGDGGPRSVQGGQGDDRGNRAGRPRHRARDARSSQHVFQARDQEDRRHEGPQGARAGDADRGHHVPGLWRADRAYAVRQRLHLAADRRGRRRGKRRQRLSRQQALRSSAGAFDDRARGQQQPGVGQRQALEQPDAGAAGLGAGRRRRGQQDPAGQSDRTRASVAGQAEVDRRQGRHRRRQVRLRRGGRSLSRQARQGARPARREGQGPDPRDQIGVEHRPSPQLCSRRIQWPSAELLLNRWHSAIRIADIDPKAPMFY